MVEVRNLEREEDLPPDQPLENLGNQLKVRLPKVLDRDNALIAECTHELTEISDLREGHGFGGEM